MFHRRKSMGAALVAVATAGTLVLSTHSPAQADFSPQPNDVVSTGSDALQIAYNFLADGYHQMPGYNTAGNRYRFVNFDSSGDAQGRSAFTDPRLLTTITGNGTVGDNGVKYVKQSDIKLLNPAISLRAGQDLYVRPSGGGAGGTTALIDDNLGYIDVGRSPNALTADQENTAQTNLGSKLIRVQFASDRQLIATASTTNAPTSLTAEQILNIYNGTWKTWGDIPGWGTAAVPGSSAANAAETIVPLILPTDAGMWTTFVGIVKAQNHLLADPDLRANSNSIQVQQNDVTAITGLPAAQQKNAIMPFPRSRITVLNNGYFTNTDTTNAYNNTTTHRTPISAAGVQLLDAASTTDSNTATSAFGGNFAVNALIRQSDANSATPWQPGSTLNWVKALFYNPGGPAPFVNTPAGQQLLQAAGVTPSYHVFGTDLAEIPQ